jgi:hypothetical protein
MNALVAWLNRRSVQLKLTLGFGVLLLTLMLVGGISVISQRTMGEQFDDLYEGSVLGASGIKDVQIQYGNMEWLVLQFVLAPDDAQRGALSAVWLDLSGNFSCIGKMYAS